MSNPYRALFYARQAAWHQTLTPEALRQAHERRTPYYRWFTKGWLPADRAAPILDIGCGAGQFLFSLRAWGYLHGTGIDVDAQQVALARSLGLSAETTPALEHLRSGTPRWDCISLMDVLEHLSFDELAVLLPLVAAGLRPGGSIIISVPNAESPNGLDARYGDITHETAFTTASLDSLLFCHGLRIRAVRDPFPAPVGVLRTAHRGIAVSLRSIEALRWRLLGLRPPTIWSAVVWCRVEHA